MNLFLRKVLIMAGIYTLADMFFSNLFFFENGKFTELTWDGWTLLIFIWWVLLSSFIIGIFKLLSLRMNNFIYESNLYIGYVALNIACARWFEVIFIGLLESKYEFFYYVLLFIYYVSIICVLFLLWKYRIEITTGMFLGEFLYSYNIVENLYNNIQRKKPLETTEGSIILIVSFCICLFMLILRNYKVYDFRNSKDKWLETISEGPYRKFSK